MSSLPPALRIVAVVTNTLCGLSNFLLGGAHLVGVLRRALEGKGFAGAPAFEYGFAFYSVVLLGVLLVGPGLACLWHTPRLWRGDDNARRAAVRWTAMLFLINAPLVPLQDFAILLTAASALNLLALVLARKVLLEGGQHSR
ncbi:MAG: hypothetical protein L0099_06590 [Acidobacteria bacterium]|nr:hypothetical protein [Acidobacteriota bacterium]